MAALQIVSEILSRPRYSRNDIFKALGTALFQGKSYQEQAHEGPRGRKGFSQKAFYDQFNGYDKYATK